MTNEEKAKEYSEDYKTKDGRSLDYCDIEKAHLDGLAEGKPKWHDLRKDPNDLPKEKTMYRVIYDNPVINHPAMWYLPSLKSWEHSGLPIIAWCELPKFEEE